MQYLENNVKTTKPKLEKILGFTLTSDKNIKGGDPNKKDCTIF